MDIPFAIPVLRVLFDFARDRSQADVGQLLLCVAEHLRRHSSASPRGRVRGLPGKGWPGAFRPTLRALERAELVEIFPDGRIRLTAPGLATAVACFSATLQERPRKLGLGQERPPRERPSGVRLAGRHARPRLVA